MFVDSGSRHSKLSCGFWNFTIIFCNYILNRLTEFFFPRRTAARFANYFGLLRVIELQTSRQNISLGNYSLRFGGYTITTQTRLTELSASQLKLGIRSEYIKIVDTIGHNTIPARVQRVEDLGNHKLVSAVSNDLDIKVKVHRDTAIPAEQVHLDLPAENCCVYADEILVQN